MPHIGDQDYESFIGTGDPAYDWQMPADEWCRLALGHIGYIGSGRRVLSIITVEPI